MCITTLTQPTALQWTALQPGAHCCAAVISCNRAPTGTSSTPPLSTWDAPGQNFVYADTKGNIGYQATGRWPIRKQGNGQAPVDGASGDYDWTGFVPYEEMPQRL